MTSGNVEAALVLEPVLRDQGEVSKERPLQLRSWSLWYLYWQVLICVFVFVFVLQTRLILFLVDFESTCLVHASLTFKVCLFFCIFCSPLQIAWLLFLFTKDQDHWMGENIFAKLDIFVCVFVFAFFVCLCRLHACCYPFCKRPIGENIFAMLDITFSAPFHKNNAFTTQYNWCMKFHQ